MRRYSRLIIIGMSGAAMQIVIMIVSTICHLISFGVFLDAFVCTLMLLFFVFINIVIIDEFIRTFEKETTKMAMGPIEEIKDSRGGYGEAVRNSKNQISGCFD